MPVVDVDGGRMNVAVDGLEDEPTLMLSNSLGTSMDMWLRKCRGDTVIWRQFSDLHTDLWLYFEQTTEQLIREAIHADTADAETTVEPASLQ